MFATIVGIETQTFTSAFAWFTDKNTVCRGKTEFVDDETPAADFAGDLTVSVPVLF